MATQESVLAPGARIVVRDAEWLVRRVDRTSTGGQALSVVGLSELVRDKEALFLTEIERAIELLDLVDTKLVPDSSSAYQASLLYIESLLRQTPPTDDNLYIGHQAAMDLVPYQLDPAIQALKQPRQRILIADAVGLGKTLEAGILLSELIRRGRGKRILVLAVKSMLTQFQKELWSRFAIPLTRLDSIGIQRLRTRIPTNHNPFYYYDKAIISIDTLKQDAEYRTYLENAYWDIIVIDEAHNVAERGAGSSLRAKLARLLAQRSDTLLMLSATPHDGKARSFASLMTMLDPTAIANPDDYGPEDIKGLFIRRFKKDIQNQVETAFKERQIRIVRCRASAAEEHAYDVFSDLQFTQLDQRRSAAGLFKTTLEKALFSSPAACCETIRNRLNRLHNSEDSDYENDIEALKELAQQVEPITPQDFSKYQQLLQVIQDPHSGFGWTGKDPQDRLVIFTERIETLRFLHQYLPHDLGLTDKQVEILYGTLSDVDQQRIVEDFGCDEAPVRLLIASDVAAEGINLHYLSHRMIHFDIPWSLMVFQQRNGRIDRYGQEHIPQIAYLVTESQNAKIRGDTRILELLIQKEDQAEKNIGDPAALMHVYDIEEEEKITARAIESGQSPDEFEATLDAKAFDPLALLMGTEQPPVGNAAETATRAMPSLFQNDFAYLQAALQHLRQASPLQLHCYAAFCAKPTWVISLRQASPLQLHCYPDEQRVELTAPEDLAHRFRFLPREIWPEDGFFILSAKKNVIQEEIKRSRTEEKAWPRIHYLWALNPVLEWVNDKVLAAFGRHQAPVLSLPGALEPNEATFVLSGLIPNRKSHPLVQRWFGCTFQAGQFSSIEDFASLVERTGLGQHTFPNRGETVDVEALQQLLPEAVQQARSWMSEQRRAFEAAINKKLDEHLTALDRLRDKQYVQIELRFENSQQPEAIRHERQQRERREVDRLFADYLDWVQETMTTEDNPYVQVITVLKGVD